MIHHLDATEVFYLVDKLFSFDDTRPDNVAVLA